MTMINSTNTIRNSYVTTIANDTAYNNIFKVENSSLVVDDTDIMNELAQLKAAVRAIGESHILLNRQYTMECEHSELKILGRKHFDLLNERPLDHVAIKEAYDEYNLVVDELIVMEKLTK